MQYVAAEKLAGSTGVSQRLAGKRDKNIFLELLVAVVVRKFKREINFEEKTGRTEWARQSMAGIQSRTSFHDKLLFSKRNNTGG